MPVRGFYVVVPPEYRSLGCLPAEQFAPAPMEFLGAPYYIGLLSAAERHGAAQQRPQEVQVVADRSRADLACGGVRVAFIGRRNLQDMPVVTMNTPRGFLRVSAPEATALDLVAYPQKTDGLHNMATVLAELVEGSDPRRFSPRSPPGWATWPWSSAWATSWTSSGPGRRPKAWPTWSRDASAVPCDWSGRHPRQARPWTPDGGCASTPRSRQTRDPSGLHH